jgi:hypothetical protein
MVINGVGSNELSIARKSDLRSPRLAYRDGGWLEKLSRRR